MAFFGSQRAARFSFWWMVGVHVLSAAGGLAIIVSSVFRDRTGVGEDWSAVVGGSLLALTFIGLLACLPALVTVRRLARDPQRTPTTATLTVLALPIVPLFVPTVRSYSVLLIVGAFAATVPLVIYVFNFVRHTFSRKVKT